MRADKIKSAAEALQDTYLELLRQAVLAESPTEDKAGVDRVGALFAAWAGERGWQVRVYPQEKAGDLIAITMNADAGEKPLCLSGHLDTVHPVGSYQDNMLVQDGDRLYGPGIADCKGGIVCGLWAMEALEKAGFTRRPVIMILQTDEECGSSLSQMETIRIMQSLAKGSVGFLNLEPNFRPNAAVIQRKGVYRCRYIVSGISCHAAVCPDGASAIAEAAHKILALEKFKDRDGIVCNCGVIHGGTTFNTVPAECQFDVDFRFAVPEQMDIIQEAVRRIAETVNIPGTSCSVLECGSRPAMQVTERNSALLKKVNEILSLAGEETLTAYPNVAASDAAYITEAGIPCLDSMGIQGAGAHTANEYITVSRFAVSALRIALIADGI